MKLLVIFVLLFAYQFSLGQGLTAEQIKLIDELINNEFIPRNNVTGMSLSIVENGITVLSKGYGKQDVENGIDVTNSTLFAIASISKSFIATLVVKTLSEQYPQYGETALDMPIVSFQPNFNFTFSDRFRSEQTTFRDLLSHRTCLDSTGYDLLFGTMIQDQEYNYRTRYETQLCGHRGGYEYNNALYALTGDLIASFVGKSIKEMVREFMLEIGMLNSTTIDHSGSYEGLPTMSQAYYMKDGAIHKYNQRLLRRMAIALGAGGILSTSTDVGKYMEFHINKGKVENKQVVSEEALSWLYKPSIRTYALSTKSDNGDGPTGFYAYGLGLMLSLYNGFAIIGHDGYWAPFSSDMEFFQYENKTLGIFMSSNGPGALLGPMTQQTLSAAIFDIVRTETSKKNLHRNTKTLKPIDFSSMRRNFKHAHAHKISEERTGRKIEFDQVIGLYGERSTGDLIIKLDPEDPQFLEVNLGEWGIGRLIQVNGSETKFSIDWKTDVLQWYYTFPTEIYPVPEFHIEFSDPSAQSLVFMEDHFSPVIFFRNATVDTFPVMPWDPVSCGPE